MRVYPPAAFSARGDLLPLQILWLLAVGLSYTGTHAKESNRTMSHGIERVKPFRKAALDDSDLSGHPTLPVFGSIRRSHYETVELYGPVSIAHLE
jgi:hypothetical protein